MHLKSSPTPLHFSPQDSIISQLTHTRSSSPAPSLLASQTLYVPIESPPTPAPSPGPASQPLSLSSSFPLLPPLSAPTLRRHFLASLLDQCTPSELLFLSSTIAPLLKRDFLKALPAELALYVLSLVDEPRTLVRASMVSRYWRDLVKDEWVWRGMCERWEFDVPIDEEPRIRRPRPKIDSEVDEWQTVHHRSPHALPPSPLSRTPSLSSTLTSTQFSYEKHFKTSYQTLLNWRTSSNLLRTYPQPDSSVVTSLALDTEWVVVGLASSLVNVFSARTGVLARTLVGHELGVWAVCLVSRGGRRMRGLRDLKIDEAGDDGERDGWRRLGRKLRYAVGLEGEEEVDVDVHGVQDAQGPTQRSSETFSSRGWGQPHALVVSGGCDKVLRVWDVDSGDCIYTLAGHTSTIRCIRVLHNRPVAVTGSRDSTLRVWDVQRGKCLRVLEGHQLSVRCLDVCGNIAVSGSYDTTCRVWNIDTGECVHVLRGHYHQIYSVVYDGIRIASGGLDTTVRVWDAVSGQCLALLQGHTALVCQLQLLPPSPSSSLPPLLATGGSDGRVITFALDTYTIQHRIAAHDSSVSSLQFDSRFLVTGGNDGRVRLYDVKEGNYIRDMTELGESVWKVAYKGDVLAVMCKRGGRTVMEIWSMKPKEGR